MEPSRDYHRSASPAQADCVETPADVHPRAGDAAPETRPRVLLVDDEDNILASLRRLLRREPYELVCAGSAEEALRVLECSSVHLIITDYRMPGMTGTELLREIQARWPNTLRIVLSGYSEVKAIINAINEGAIYKFLTKPWNDEEIKLNIRRALEQYALEEENQRLVREIGQQNERLLELNRLLDQRATDASTGLTYAQELLETIDAGVLTVDTAGLIVNANLRAAELLSRRQAEFIGISAETVLPEAMKMVLPPATVPRAANAAGSFEHHGRTLQWRTRNVVVGGDCQATVATIWEDLPCPPA